MLYSFVHVYQKSDSSKNANPDSEFPNNKENLFIALPFIYTRPYTFCLHHPKLFIEIFRTVVLVLLIL
jgi:hypothetical protein